LSQLDNLEKEIQKIESENKDNEVDETNPNTKKTQKNSLDNFERFFEEKLNTTSKQYIKSTFKKKGLAGVYTLLQAWIYWNKKKGLVTRSIRSMFSPIKANLDEYGIDSKKLKFGKVIKEARGILTVDMIENLINHADKNRKCIYLLQSCSGMRIGEIAALKRKHLDTTKDRIQINLPASMTKAKEERITFVSKECEKLLTPIIEHLEPEDSIFHTSKGTEDHAFRRIASLAGYNEKFETTGYNKINTHAIRAWAITRMNKINEFGFGSVISGHGYYMKVYNRKTQEDILEDYLKAEPFLQVFNRIDETEELKSLKDRVEQLESIKGTVGESNKILDNMGKEKYEKFRTAFTKALDEALKNPQK